MKTKKSDEVKCIVPDCDANRSYGRGLCVTHYGSIHHMIRRGITTWDDLEKRGKVLPKSEGRRSRFKAWALEGKETKSAKKGK